MSLDDSADPLASFVRRAAGSVVAGRYEIVRLVGTGGMGAVYEARHQVTRRRVALKLLHRDVALDAGAMARFVRESQAPSSIGHPNIVEVLDAGQDVDGVPYLVLEYLEGEDLRSAMHGHALPPEVVVPVALELLDALAAAHARGFVHRDIKPENVYLARDERGRVRVKLLDFGIARQVAAQDNSLTRSGAIVGTPFYMSPEQARGERVDGRSDLWSVGAMMFHLLAGRVPFAHENYNLLIVAIVTSRAPSLGEVAPALPPPLVAAVDRALEPDVNARWQSASAMAAALTGLVAPEGFAALITGPATNPDGAARTPRPSHVTPRADSPAPIDPPPPPATSTPLEWSRNTPRGGATDRTSTPLAFEPTVRAASHPSAPSAPPAVPRAPAEEPIDVAGLPRHTRPRAPGGLTPRARAVVLVAGAALGVGGVVALARRPSGTGAAARPLAAHHARPRLLAPAAGSTVGTRRPTLRWRAPDELEAVTLELCRARACASVARRLYVTGDRTTLEADLAPGAWFWRLTGLAGGQSTGAPSAVWSFVVPPGETAARVAGAVAPDVNGDGLGDVVVGAPRAADNLGGVYVFHGGPRPIATGAAAARALATDGMHTRFGATLATAGDVNGDGVVDLLVGAPEAFNQAGRAYVYLGGRGAGGLATQPAAVFEGPGEPGAYFGAQVARAGDVNGDGFADVLVASLRENGDAGRVMLYAGHGRAALATAPAATLVPAEGAGAWFGAGLAGGSDLDGDGLSDVVVGARGVEHDTGHVAVYLGSAEGLSQSPSHSVLGPDGPQGRFGELVAMTGDVNGDGLGDLAVSAPRAAGEQGRVYVYAGARTTGLASAPLVVLAPPEGAGPTARFGASLAAGDVNGDGRVDLLVGADHAADRAGRVFVYLGDRSAAGLAATPSAVLAVPSPEPQRLGAALALVDVDGDGRDDALVGAPEARGGEGAVYLFYGGAGGASAAADAVFALPPDNGATPARFGAVLASSR